MSVPCTLCNKPRVNYPVLNSGMEAPSPSSSEMVQTPIPEEYLPKDQAEHEALEGEREALSAELQ